MNCGNIAAAGNRFMADEYSALIQHIMRRAAYQLQQGCVILIKAQNDSSEMLWHPGN
jgi:hypothetical protein